MNEKKVNIIKNVLVAIGFLILFVTCILIYCGVVLNQILIDILCFGGIALVIVGKIIHVIKNKKQGNIKREIITTLILLGVIVWALFFSK